MSELHTPGSRPPPPRIGGSTTSAPVVESGDPAREQADSEPRRRDQLLWLWPVGAVAVMAAAGQFFGAFGALLSALVIAATLVLLIGDPSISLRTRIWITALAVVLAAAVMVGRHAGLEVLAPPSDSAKPLDLRGRVVRADEIRGRSLREAQLAGAVLDGLDLRGHDLTGVKARGASFRLALLDGVSLVRADLRGADFTNACLEKANLTAAELGGVVATGADIRDVTADQDGIKTVASWSSPGTSVPQQCL